MDAQTSHRLRNSWIIVSAVAAGVPIFSLWNYHAGTSTKTVTLINAVVAMAFLYLILFLGMRKGYQRNSSELPRQVIWGGLLLACVSLAVTALGIHVIRGGDSLSFIANSDIPLGKIEPEQKRLVIELIRRRAANSRENDKDIADAKAHPLNPQIYTPESFSNRVVMEGLLARLTTIIDKDLRYSTKQNEAMQDFRQKMSGVDLAYLKSWDKDEAAQYAAEANVIQTEKDWFAGVNALYGYAISHSDEITVKDGQIKINSILVQTQFNQQLEDSEALHDKLMHLEQILAERQQQANRDIMNR